MASITIEEKWYIVFVVHRKAKDYEPWHTFIFVLDCISFTLGLMGGILAWSSFNEKCPLQPMIPTYLKVALVTSAIMYSLSMMIIGIVMEKAVTPALVLSVIYMLVLLFHGVWFIYGNIIVFTVKSRWQYDKEDKDTYCYEIIYGAAYYLIIMKWIVFALFCLCMGVVMKKRHDS